MAKQLPEPDLSGIGRMQRALLIRLMAEGAYLRLLTDDNYPGKTQVSVMDAEENEVAGTYMCMFHKLNERYLLVHKNTWRPCLDVTIVEYELAPGVKQLLSNKTKIHEQEKAL